jgi:hypothetical protein
MGLDISAYSNVEKIADLPFTKDGIDWDKVEGLESEEKSCTLIKNDSFPEHCLDLEEAVYRFNGEFLSFRAGGYGGYNRFRDLLSRVIIGSTAEEVWEDPEKFKDRPFYQLINFSDCEGCIGPEVSARLYRDFVENEEKFVESLTTLKIYVDLDVDWMKASYSNWKRAFELAKDHGFVHFG